MILPEANPEQAIKQLRILRKKFSIFGNDVYLDAVDDAISCINRQNMQVQELKDRVSELEETICLMESPVVQD